MTSIVPRSGALRPGVRMAGRDPDWMLQQLPVGLLDDDDRSRTDPSRANFFVRFVSIFQELGDSLFADADNVEHVLDLSVAPPAMVRWLGSWIGMDAIDAEHTDALQRRLVAAAADTLTWRGTRHGLERFLEVISNGPAKVVDGGGVWRAGDAPTDTAWVRMTVQSAGMDEDDLIEHVRDEVPAHVRAELYVGERLIWSSEGGKQ